MFAVLADIPATINRLDGLAGLPGFLARQLAETAALIGPMCAFGIGGPAARHVGAGEAAPLLYAVAVRPQLDELGARRAQGTDQPGDIVEQRRPGRLGAEGTGRRSGDEIVELGVGHCGRSGASARTALVSTEIRKPLRYIFTLADGSEREGVAQTYKDMKRLKRVYGARAVRRAPAEDVAPELRQSPVRSAENEYLRTLAQWHRDRAAEAEARAGRASSNDMHQAEKHLGAFHENAARLIEKIADERDETPRAPKVDWRQV